MNQHQDQEDETTPTLTPRCDWDFNLSTVISPHNQPEASDVLGSIELDPTHRLLATGGIARKIRIYNLSTLLPTEIGPINSVPTLLDHGTACEFYLCAPAKIGSLKWRPDSQGRLIGSGDYDGVVTEYDLERRVAVAERDEHGGRRVWSLDYSAGGELGASGSDDGTAQLWDPRCSGGVGVVRPSGAPVCCVEFDRDGGSRIGLGCADRRAYVYDARAVGSGPVAVFAGHERTVTYVRFVGPGKAVSSGTDGCHRMWDPRDGREIRRYRGHLNGRSFVGMGVWKEGGLIGCGSESNEVFVYDLRWGVPVWVREFGGRERGFVSAVCWKGEGDDEFALVAGGSDGVVQIFGGRRKGC